MFACLFAGLFVDLFVGTQLAGWAVGWLGCILNGVSPFWILASTSNYYSILSYSGVVRTCMRLDYAGLVSPLQLCLSNG